MRTWRLIAGGLTAALALTACSSADADDPDAADGSLPVISMAVTDPGQLIPARQSVAYDFSMAVWAPLTNLSADGDLSYVQAESIESDDAVTWTVTLRDGWTFHNGEPVTAQSYVDSWNAAAYGPNAFENSGQLANIVGYDDVSPAEGEPTTTEMSGLEVIDELTFTVTLNGPDGQFPLQVSQAQTAMYPMPAEALDDFEAYNTRPIGNGPFMLTNDYVEMEELVTVAYEEYQGEPVTSGGITFVPYTDNTTAYTDVLAGNIDIASVPTARLTQAEADFGERFYSFDAPGISFLGLPLWDERYQDIRVRQAISMAMDREAISDVIYGGSFAPATAWTPPIEPGTPEGICGVYCEFDPQAATDLLDEAGGFEGEMEIYYPGGSGLDELYTAYANQLRQNLGVDALATPSADWAEFLATRDNADITGPFFSRWGALYPSQQNTLRVFFVEGGGCTNCIPWYSEDVAAGIAAADAVLDPDEAGAAYAEVQEIIQEEFPAVPMFFEMYSYVTSERIAELVPSTGNPVLTDVVLAGDA